MSEAQAEMAAAPAQSPEKPTEKSVVRRQRWFEFKRPIPRSSTIALGVAVWVIFFALWEAAAEFGWVNVLFMPPPHKVRWIPRPW